MSKKPSTPRQAQRAQMCSFFSLMIQEYPFRLPIVFLFLSLVFLFVPETWAASETIEGLSPPAYVKPPRHPDDSENTLDNLKRIKKSKSHDRRIREPKNEDNKIPWKEKIARSLVKDLTSPRELNLLVELAPVFPVAMTSGSKSGYTLNPTSLFQMMWRQKSPHKNRPAGIFWGLRVAAFSGQGFYKNIPGSFGNLFFGPSIGWGSVSRRVEDVGRQPSNREPSDSSSEDFFTYSSADRSSGYLWTTGISLLASQGKSDVPTAEAGQSDFQNKSLRWDPPGIWTEFRWLQIHYGAIAYNPLVGVHLSSQVVYLYLGIGLGGWT